MIFNSDVVLCFQSSALIILVIVSRYAAISIKTKNLSPSLYALAVGGSIELYVNASFFFNFDAGKFAYHLGNLIVIIAIINIIAHTAAIWKTLKTLT